VHLLPHEQNADIVTGLLGLDFVLARDGMTAPKLMSESLVGAA